MPCRRRARWCSTSTTWRASCCWRALLAWQARRLRAFEAQACRRADRVLACSGSDAMRLRALAPEGRYEVIPNGVDLERLQPDGGASETEGSLVFVGQMGWFPNRDGVRWFTAEVLPLIRAQCRAHLTVIGHRGDEADPAGDDPGWHFAGFVDDLRAAVLQAAVFVVPLRAGSGTRLKLLEAMALGKAIVSTRIGAEGLELEHEEHALLADRPADLAAAVCRLLHDAPLRRRLGSAARALAERRYGWDAIGTRMLSTYAELLDARQARQR